MTNDQVGVLVRRSFTRAALVAAFLVGVIFGAAQSRADDFKITIDDKSMLLGITAAREAHNAALPAPVTFDGNIVAKSMPIDTDQEYLQMVVTDAARSYAKQHGTDLAAIDDAIAVLTAKRGEVMAKGGK